MLSTSFWNLFWAETSDFGRLMLVSCDLCRVSFLAGMGMSLKLFFNFSILIRYYLDDIPNTRPAFE